MSQALRNAFGHFTTGVTVITAVDAEGNPVGMTANSFSSLSLDPPLVLWSIASNASNFAVFSTASGFAVHVLHAGQQDLATLFATRNTDRFKGLLTSPGAAGAPLLQDFHARFDCATHATHPGGDHLIIVGRVLDFTAGSGEPLVFYRGRFAASLPDRIVGETRP